MLEGLFADEPALLQPTRGYMRLLKRRPSQIAHRFIQQLAIIVVQWRERRRDIEQLRLTAQISGLPDPRIRIDDGAQMVVESIARLQLS